MTTTRTSRPRGRARQTRSTASAAEVARELAGKVRELNYATLPADGYPGLECPADVYAVLGALSGAVYGLRQIAEQLRWFLVGQENRPGLVNNYDHSLRGPKKAVDQALSVLFFADRPLVDLTVALDRAQQAVAGLAVVEDGAR